MNFILGLPPRIPKGTPVALDVELFGADGKRLHRPTGEFACLSICYDPKVVYLIENVKDVPAALKRIQAGLWIMHNSVFDIRQLRRWAKVPDGDWWDTLIVERELYGGYYDEFGLDDLSRRYLDEYLSKEDRKLFEKATRMDAQLRRYSAQDGSTTLRIYQQQVKEYQKVYADEDIWRTIDRPALYAFLDFRGMMLDVPAWQKLIDYHRGEQDRIRKELDFNPGSWQQVQQALRKQGIRVASTGVQELEHHSDNPLVAQILEYRGFAKAAGTYGENFLSMIEKDGRIHASFNVVGAETGRTCVSGDTLIPTNLGTFRICELPLISSSPCTVITHRGNAKRIKRLVYKGREMMYRVVLENGKSISCTQNHKFLTPNGWEPLNDLIIGDSVYSYKDPDLWEEKDSIFARLPKSVFGFGFKYLLYSKSKIADILPMGVDDVWDIEVEEDASYLAHGFVNHNSSAHPNFQNIPIRSGPHFRKCFIAPRGRRYVIADFSQQEPRINAYIARDTRAIEIFKKGGDVYVGYGEVILGERIQKSDPRRKILKPVVLGLAYGLSEYGLTKQVNSQLLKADPHAKLITIEESRKWIQRLKRMFPLQAQHIDRMRETAGDYVRTPAGRRCWINRYSYQWINTVLNAPVQGGAADGSKIAMAYIREQIRLAKLDAFFVNFVHDEILVECSTVIARRVAQIVRDGMIQSAEIVCPGVPFEADVYIGKCWADKENDACKVHFKK